MKTCNYYLALALFAGSVAICSTAKAQDMLVDEAVTVTEFECDNTTHYFSNWRDNWFIELSAGANQPLVEKGFSKQHNVDGKKWTAAYSAGFGRWFSPYMGFRLKGMYGALHWDNPVTQLQADRNLGAGKMRHAGVHLELMWDMFNSLGGVNPDRVFSIIPFAGIGGEASWRFRGNQDGVPAGTNDIRTHQENYSSPYKQVQWTLPVTAGIQFRFRLSKYVDFFAEARSAFYADNWNNSTSGNSIDALVQAMGGFNFNIGGRGWNRFNECGYVSQVASLNGQVNDLRAQLLACGQTVAALQSQLPCPEVVQKDCIGAPLMATVRFNINSDEILPDEEVNVYSMAEWLKANPKEKIVIAGYADKDTGTAEYNMKLSQRRADAVRNALVNEYGISADRLETKSFGSEVQEYPSNNDWNRIVIFRQ